MDREGEGEGERVGGRARERKTGERRGAHLYPYPTQSTCDYRRTHALRNQRRTPRARQSPNPSHVRPQTLAMTVSGVCLSRGSVSLAMCCNFNSGTYRHYSANASTSTVTCQAHHLPPHARSIRQFELIGKCMNDI